MKPFEINEKSWHYWLANGGPMDLMVIYPKSICQYIRKIIFSTLLLLCLIAMISFVVSNVLGGLVGIVLLLLGHEIWTHHSFLAAGVIIDSIAILASGIVYTAIKLKKYLRQNRNYRDEPSQPSFIKEAYRSWHDKVCFPVTFVNKDDDNE